MCVVTLTVITAKHPHVPLQLLMLGFGAFKKKKIHKILILKLGKHLVGASVFTYDKPLLHFDRTAAFVLLFVNLLVS